MALSLGLYVYRAATALFSPAGRILLKQRAARGKEDKARLGERLGTASRGGRRESLSGCMAPASANVFRRCR